jgi:hypothetical protein
VTCLTTLVRKWYGLSDIGIKCVSESKLVLK